MSRHTLLCPALLLSLLHSGAEAQGTGRRLALVIGNQKYAKSALCATGNDASDMSGRLKEFGFLVEEVHDADLSAMFAAIARLQQHKPGSEDIVLFFYAGHGIDAEGQNFLLPVDYTRHQEGEVRAYAFPVQRVIEGIKGAGSSIVIIDACRTRELDSSSKPDGLAPFTDAGNSLIITSASPGEEAKEGVCEGDHPNGVFTKALIEWLERPGLTIDQIFEEVRKAVRKESKDKQTPQRSGALRRPFVFHQAESCNSNPENPDSAESLIKAAECAIKQRKEGKAVMLAEQAVELEQGNAEYRWVLGRAKLAEQNPHEAKEAFEKAVELDPTHAKYRFHLGSLLLDLQEYKRAQQELLEARKIAADWPGLCPKLAEAYEKTNNRRLGEQIRASCR